MGDGYINKSSRARLFYILTTQHCTYCLPGIFLYNICSVPWLKDNEGMSEESESISRSCDGGYSSTPRPAESSDKAGLKLMVDDDDIEVEIVLLL
jgi:hypothetical protein